jgi:hypothetical protein
MLRLRKTNAKLVLMLLMCSFLGTAASAQEPSTPPAEPAEVTLAKSWMARALEFKDQQARVRTVSSLAPLIARHDANEALNALQKALRSIESSSDLKDEAKKELLLLLFPGICRVSTEECEKLSSRFTEEEKSRPLMESIRETLEDPKRVLRLIELAMNQKKLDTRLPYVLSELRKTDPSSADRLFLQALQKTSSITQYLLPQGMTSIKIENGVSIFDLTPPWRLEANGIIESWSARAVQMIKTLTANPALPVPQKAEIFIFGKMIIPKLKPVQASEVWKNISTLSYDTQQSGVSAAVRITAETLAEAKEKAGQSADPQRYLVSFALDFASKGKFEEALQLANLVNNDQVKLLMGIIYYYQALSMLESGNTPDSLWLETHLDPERRALFWLEAARIAEGKADLQTMFGAVAAVRAIASKMKDSGQGFLILGSCQFVARHDPPLLLPCLQEGIKSLDADKDARKTFWARLFWSEAFTSAKGYRSNGTIPVKVQAGYVGWLPDALKADKDNTVTALTSSPMDEGLLGQIYVVLAQYLLPK